MEIYSDNPEAGGDAVPAAPVEHRVRWGNVALAIAALAAVAAAVLMPRADTSRIAEPVARAPLKPLVTAGARAVPTPAAGRVPRSHVPKPAKTKRKRRRKRHAHVRARGTPTPAVAVPTPAIPAAPSQSPAIPAAEREFGL